MTVFMDCTSLSISYNTMGIATVSFTMVHNTNDFEVMESVSAGGQNFNGHVISATMNRIPNTNGWYETHVTLLATTD